MTAIDATRFIDFETGSLAGLLGLKKAPFVEPNNPFPQLAYIERYLSAPCFDCKSIILEQHYIDRDYIEDYSVFYSLSLFPYPNSCKRIHFFKTTAEETRQQLENFIRMAAAEEQRSEYRKAIRKWCRENLLGFSVIKPLDGCPVGRTVLLAAGPKADDGCSRVFKSTREYKTHLFGLEFVINGLAFQQQDLGVSACATTALWCSLQKVSSKEEVAHATPAQITRYASQFSLPFGRPMPSGGLNINQMCLAIQSLGLSPSLIRADDTMTALGAICSACNSGFAPVLILESLEASSSTSVHHAVTVVGVKAHHKPADESMSALEGEDIIDLAESLKALYVHDDRRGPYLRADINRTELDGNLASGRLVLDVLWEGGLEKWLVSHVLVPMHPKVRMSFADLRSLTFEHLAQSLWSAEQVQSDELKTDSGPIEVSIWVEKAPDYFRSLIEEGRISNLDEVQRLSAGISFPRYVGVVRFVSRFSGTLDVLVDTTSTLKNPKFISIFDQSRTGGMKYGVRALAYECKCDFHSRAGGMGT